MCTQMCTKVSAWGSLVLLCGLPMAGQKGAIKPAPGKPRASEYVFWGPWLYLALSVRLAAGEEAQQEASQGSAESLEQRGVSAVLAKAKHSPRSFPPFLLVSYNTFLPHSK